MTTALLTEIVMKRNNTETVSTFITSKRTCKKLSNTKLSVLNLPESNPPLLLGTIKLRLCYGET